MSKASRDLEKENSELDPSESYRKRLARDGWSFFPTTDDWAPNFPGNLVGVRFQPLPMKDGKYRIPVWGADDDGMELDLDSEEQARDIYLKLPSIITKDILRSLGFCGA